MKKLYFHYDHMLDLDIRRSKKKCFFIYQPFYRYNYTANVGPLNRGKRRQVTSTYARSLTPRMTLFIPEMHSAPRNESETTYMYHM